MALHDSAKQPRRLAYEVLLRVADGAFSDLALDAALGASGLDQRDRRLATELVYGVLRRRGRLDFALTPFCRQPLGRLQPEVLWLLRLGAYQLLETDRIPVHAAVDTSVQLAREVKQERSAGLINAVLRALDRGRADIPWPTPETIRPYLEHVCSLPRWLAREIMAQQTNAEARALGESLASPAPLTLRTNLLKTTPAEYLAALAAVGHRARAGSFVPEAIVVEELAAASLPGNEQGWYQVQDEASMLVPHLLQVEPGQRILDACAAPGGKTTQLAALVGNQAEIIALDKHPRRVELIRQGAARLGAENIQARCWDLRATPDFLEPHSCDRILVDAPCSGLGVLRRNPEGRWNKTAAKLKELAALQGQLLDSVAPLLKPEGLLLYSVCTFSRSETEAVVKAFLARQTDFRLVDLRSLMPAEWTTLFSSDGTLRTFPHRHGGIDAFFAACLRRH